MTENAIPESPRSKPNPLAGQLRELRARRGLTQEQVARRLGCHESAVSRWESGGRFPTSEDLVLLADLFHVSVDSLLGRAEQHTVTGAALVDQVLLDRLAACGSVEEFDRLIEAHADQAIWLPVPEGGVLVTVAEAMRRARKVAEKYRGSKYVDRLFRPKM